MKQVYALLLLVSLQSFGQDYARSITLISEKTSGERSSMEYEVMLKNAGGYVPGNINNIPTPVLTTFTNDYENAVNVSWFLNEKQSTVYFNWNNELVIIKYKKDGSSFFTRKTYTVEKLDRPFNDLLKREIGTRHDVNYITEFFREDSHNYEVNMSNDKEWLMLKLTRDKVTGSLAILEKKVFPR